MNDRAKVFDSADAAVADIHDGASVMFGGFASAGNPTNLIRALVRRGTTGLTGIANNVGLGNEIDDLCEKHQLRRFISSFAIRASAARKSRIETQYLAGELELEIVPQGTLAERIRAAGAGIPAFYTPTGAGTIVAANREVRRFGDTDYLLEHALPADFALIKAHRADTFGNLVYRGAGRNFNVDMATAAKTVIVEVEELVEVGEIEPDAVVTPGIYVDRIVRCDPIPPRWE